MKQYFGEYIRNLRTEKGFTLTQLGAKLDLDSANLSKIENGKSCSDYYDKGSATQWYTSIGMPLIPLFDIHLSYRSITAKNIKKKETGKKDDNSGSVTGIGIAFNF